MKKVKYFALAFITMFLVVLNVNAQDETSIKTFDELLTAAENGGSIKLDADITLTNDVRIRKALTLDLNGHTINTDRGWTLIVLSDTKVTDSVGTGKITSGDLGAWESGVDYQMIQVGGSAADAVGNFTLESGTLNGKWAIYNRNGNVTIEDGVLDTTVYCVYSYADTLTTINGGKFTSTTSNQAFELSGGKIVFNGGEVTTPNGSGVVAFKNSEVEINDVDIDAKDFALSGNGSQSGANEGTNAKFTINGGVLKSKEAPAIYAPQVNGETLITGGEFHGVESAIEIRAGKLTITDGIFYGNGEAYQVDANGNGTTTVGAAVAVAQHTTKQPIDVKITGGEFYGYRAISEANPQKNSEEYISQVKISIEGGYFESTSDEVIYSEDLTKFISAGVFSNAVDLKYLVEDSVLSDSEDGYVVIPNIVLVNENSNVVVISASALPNDSVLKIEELASAAIEAAKGKVEEKYDADKEVKDAELLAVYDISVERPSGAVELDNGSFLVLMEIDKNLLKYDNYKVLYFDDNGDIKEEVKADLLSELLKKPLTGDLANILDEDTIEELKLDMESEGKDVIVFEVSHFSTYGVVGYNDVTTTNPNTLDNAYIYVIIGLFSLIAVVLTFNRLKKLAK